MKSYLTFGKKLLTVALAAAVIVAAKPLMALCIGDAVRMKNEVPNELVGVGIVVGLDGTGDGGDFLPTIRPLKEMLKKFDDPVQVEKELKNANNVAIVSVSMPIPIQGAHSGEELDIKISALAAKSLRGGRLFPIPMLAPVASEKVILGWARGMVTLDDEKHPTEATIRGGGVLTEDILPDDIKDDTFTLVIHPKMAARGLATAIADQINEDVAPQTAGTAIAIAIDSTSVQVMIPKPERSNPTPFIARMLSLPLPTLPEPARVTIDTRSKTMVFSETVEVAPTMISQGNLTITVGQPPNPAGTKVPFAVIDPKGNGNAKLRDLQNAFNLLKVSAQDRIDIVTQLHAGNFLKAEFIVTP